MTMSSGSPFCDNTGSTSPDQSAMGQGSSGVQPMSTPVGQAGSATGQAREQVSDAAKEMKGAASQAKTAVTDTTRRTAQQAKDAAGQVVEQAKGQAKQLTQQATEQGTAMLNDQKSRAADSLGGIGSALRRAAQTLHEEQDEQLAQYTDSLADGVESSARYLRERDCRDLLSDAGDLARRRPELVLGGAFVAGLALMRFLKASSPSSGAYDRTSGQSGMQYATSDDFLSDQTADPDMPRSSANVAFNDQTHTAPPGSLTL
ncbi:MAG TPA: hypothetical protein VGR35_10885 [Tepidisphaeraceae bacterium]|nr:hypothetical protein [Tepidisphaeraceae bacterium]